MRRSPNPRVLLALAILGLAAGALGAVALASPGAAADDVFEIRMLDGSIELEQATPPAGPQVIEITNVGSEEHELVILRTERAPEELALGLHGVSIRYSGELVVGEDHFRLGHKHRPGDVLGQLPGERTRVQVELAPGHYVAYCQTGSHYMGGERTGFTVE